LGNTAFVTDRLGEVYQHLEYFPFGETFFEEKNNSWRTPYLFSGKELDDITALSYYGARYYDSRTSVWQSVDPKSEQYAAISPYSFGANNPVRYTDDDGGEIVVHGVPQQERVLQLIHARSRGTFKFDKYGRLQLASRAGENDVETSRYYREKLIKAIESDKKIFIAINSTRYIHDTRRNAERKWTSKVVDEEDIDRDWGGGVTFNIGRGFWNIIISGSTHNDTWGKDGTKLVDEPADVLLHELVGHAIPRQLGKKKGNAIEKENKARRQLKGSLKGAERRDEHDHHI